MLKMGNIYILLLIFNITLEAKLVRNGNYLIDDINRLIWLDVKDNIYLRVTHQEAIEHCKKVSNGHWRLPTVSELKTILDINRLKKDEISIKKEFKYILKDDYWVSDRTWIRNFGLYAYYLRVKFGTFYYQNRTYKKFFICVKDMR